MPQSLDNWPAIVIAVLAAVAALLVPLNGFFKTLFDYRIEVRKAEAFKPDTAREVTAVQPGSSTVFDSIGTADHTAALKLLIDAVRDLTAAIREETRSDEAQHHSELAAALAKFTRRMDQFDQNEPPPARSTRR